MRFFIGLLTVFLSLLSLASAQSETSTSTQTMTRTVYQVYTQYATGTPPAETATANSTSASTTFGAIVPTGISNGTSVAGTGSIGSATPNPANYFTGAGNSIAQGVSTFGAVGVALVAGVALL